LTLVATTADLRPWLSVARQFAVLKDQRMTIIGSRSQLEAASDQMITDVLPFRAHQLT
jgi:hypothetical protein